MTTLTVMVTGAVLGSGISKKSGSPKPYQMANVMYLAPSESFQNDDHNIQRCGMQEKQIPMVFNQNVYAQFAQLSYPLQLQLILEPDPSNPTRNVVVDFKE
ncbi:hypothetical protein [Photobacterium rosenbergii]|uniref:VSK-int n=1 Tax=Photobacterium rosenbergii TaxID=294936 RepID=A0A2T3NFN6_9GAMM|nr:hypothetical protein [Photobacterium rosenbergii]MBY5949313.1 hypothetical protein [Photobacterium rosenbergii]PSW13331.1 hypothetical protein C9J01_10815 [Photobacterium rosenbergii]